MPFPSFPSAAAVAELPAPTADDLLDILPWGLLVLGAGGRVQRINQQAAAWWGLPPAAVLGQPPAALPPASLPAAQHAALQQLAAGATLPPTHFFVPARQQWLAQTSTRQADYTVVYWHDVTEQAAQQASRLQATEELRQTELHFRAIVDLMPGLLWRNDMNGSATWYNQRWYDYTGLTLPESAADGWLNMVHPDDQARSLRNFRQALATDRPLLQEHRLRHAAGEYRWFQVQALPVRGRHGRTEEWLGWAIDIHERRLAEDALRRSEAKYRSLFESMVEGFAVCELIRDADGQTTDWRFLELNPAWEHQTGLSRPAVLASTARQLLPDLAPWFPVYTEMVASGETARFEHYLGSLDRWYQVIAFPQGGDRFVVLYDDISVRKRAEQQLQVLTASLEQQVAERTQALQATTNLLRSVYDTSLIGMSVLRAVRDETGQIQDFCIDIANQELARATGRRHLVGKHYLQEYPGLREAGVFDQMLRVMATGEPGSLEYCHGEADSSQWFSSTFAKLGDGLVASTLDISAQKQAEQELRKNLGLLEQSEQIAEMGSWVYEPRTKAMRWSAGLYRLFGLPPGSAIVPRTYLDFVVADDQPVVERLVRRLQEGKTSFEETLRIEVAGQGKTLRLKARLLPAGPAQPLHLLGVALDISTVQRLEQENLRLSLSQQQARIGAVLEAQEEERRRLAESLHNGLGQLLYATKLQLDQLARAPELAAPPLAAARREASRLLSQVIQQARTLSHELTPGIVADFGLAAALHDICRNLSSPRLRWQCLVHLEEEAVLPLPLQVAAYRLAQEITQNIVKHAQATHATLEAETLPGWLVLRAEDNGLGFEPTAATSGIGLKTMRHRVALLGGTVHLSSVPGQGTQLQLRIPLLTPPATP